MWWVMGCDHLIGPQEAYETFMSSDIDALCIGHYLLTKESQRV